MPDKPLSDRLRSCAAWADHNAEHGYTPPEAESYPFHVLASLLHEAAAALELAKAGEETADVLHANQARTITELQQKLAASNQGRAKARAAMRRRTRARLARTIRGQVHNRIAYASEHLANVAAIEAEHDFPVTVTITLVHSSADAVRADDTEGKPRTVDAIDYWLGVRDGLRNVTRVLDETVREASEAADASDDVS